MAEDKYSEVDQEAYDAFSPLEKREYWEYEFRQKLEPAGLGIENLSQEEIYRLAGKLTLSDLNQSRNIKLSWEKFPEGMKTLVENDEDGGTTLNASTTDLKNLILSDLGIEDPQLTDVERRDSGQVIWGKYTQGDYMSPTYKGTPLFKNDEFLSWLGGGAPSDRGSDGVKREATEAFARANNMPWPPAWPNGYNYQRMVEHWEDWVDTKSTGALRSAIVDSEHGDIVTLADGNYLNMDGELQRTADSVRGTDGNYTYLGYEYSLPSWGYKFKRTTGDMNLDISAEDLSDIKLSKQELLNGGEMQYDFTSKHFKGEEVSGAEDFSWHRPNGWVGETAGSDSAPERGMLHIIDGGQTIEHNPGDPSSKQFQGLDIDEQGNLVFQGRPVTETDVMDMASGTNKNHFRNHAGEMAWNASNGWMHSENLGWYYPSEEVKNGGAGWINFQQGNESDSPQKWGYFDPDAQPESGAGSYYTFQDSADPEKWQHLFKPADGHLKSWDDKDAGYKSETWVKTDGSHLKAANIGVGSATDETNPIGDTHIMPDGSVMPGATHPTGEDETVTGGNETVTGGNETTVEEWTLPEGYEDGYVTGEVTHHNGQYWVNDSAKNNLLEPTLENGWRQLSPEEIISEVGNQTEGFKPVTPAFMGFTGDEGYTAAYNQAIEFARQNPIDDDTGRPADWNRTVLSKIWDKLDRGSNPFRWIDKFMGGEENLNRKLAFDAAWDEQSDHQAYKTRMANIAYEVQLGGGPWADPSADPISQALEYLQPYYARDENGNIKYGADGEPERNPDWIQGNSIYGIDEDGNERSWSPSGWLPFDFKEHEWRLRDALKTEGGKYLDMFTKQDADGNTHNDRVYDANKKFMTDAGILNEDPTKSMLGKASVDAANYIYGDKDTAGSLAHLNDQYVGARKYYDKSLANMEDANWRDKQRRRAPFINATADTSYLRDARTRAGERVGRAKFFGGNINQSDFSNAQGGLRTPLNIPTSSSYSDGTNTIFGNLEPTKPSFTGLPATNMFSNTGATGASATGATQAAAADPNAFGPKNMFMPQANSNPSGFGTSAFSTEGYSAGMRPFLSQANETLSR